MDRTQQAGGEKQVRELLIDPLRRRGLVKPSKMTRDQFEEMVADVCAKLAYMTEDNLAALEEQAAANAGGKDRDQMPIAQRILEWAGQIQPPADDASPLIRAVFANALGQDAIDGGWAPELLADLRQNRRWPTTYAVNMIRERAAGSIRQMQLLDDRLRQGGDLSEGDAGWRARRLAALERCRRISRM